jgi:TRAP-type C4-dicarboxylate transport system substrate-binding protein
VLVVSKKCWEELTAEEQAIFRAAARESALAMRSEWQKLEATSRREAEAQGVSVVTLQDRSGFEAAVRPIVERYASEPSLAALVARIRQAR